MTPCVIKGGIYIDKRGTITYANEFDLEPIKRMYIITHLDKRTIRAWQGHKKESKWFKCLNGTFVVAWKKINDFSNPDDTNTVEYKILKKEDNYILYIPPGYVNGLRALEDNSEIMVFSDYYISESLDDKIRFPEDLWFDWYQF